MSENRVLRRIFGPKWDEVTGEWRKLHNEELNVLYSSPNIVLVIKSRRMRWAGHVARMGEGRGVYRASVGKRNLTLIGGVNIKQGKTVINFCIHGAPYVLMDNCSSHPERLQLGP